MIIFILLLLLFYTFVLSRLIQGVHRLTPGENSDILNISVVVAARNEEKNLEYLLNALVKQDYPIEKHEIIIVDDRSTDDTAKIVNTFEKKYSHVRLIKITKTEQGIAPKKKALDEGIRHAKGEIVVITDADTIPGIRWLKSINNYFDPSVGLVAGFSPLDRSKNSNIFSKFIRLDSLALAAVAAGSFGLDFPLTCNARNLAYRKKVYEQIGGFRDIGHIISGDDDLLLHTIRKKTGWQMKYMIDREAMVSSIAPSSFKEFANQRIRHASKGKYYKWSIKTGLSAVYLLNLLFVIFIPLSIMHVEYLGVLFFALFIKSLFEFILLFRVAKIFNVTNYLFYFPLAIFFHIPYVVIFGLWGQFGKFHWKGDSFNANIQENSC